MAGVTEERTSYLVTLAAHTLHFQVLPSHPDVLVCEPGAFSLTVRRSKIGTEIEAFLVVLRLFEVLFVRRLGALRLGLLRADGKHPLKLIELSLCLRDVYMVLYVGIGGRVASKSTIVSGDFRHRGQDGPRGTECGGGERTKGDQAAEVASAGKG